MDEIKTYALTIEGQSGTFEVENLTMNGSNYVSEKQVDTKKWPAVFKLTAKDADGSITEEMGHAKLVQQERYDWDGGKFYLAFAAVSEQEMNRARIDGNTEKIGEIDETSTTGLLAVTDLYEQLIEKGVL